MARRQAASAGCSVSCETKSPQRNLAAERPAGESPQAGSRPAVGRRAPAPRPHRITAMPVSAQYSVTIRVELDARQEPLGKLTAAIAEAGGQLQGIDLVPGAGGEGKRVREFTIDARDSAALGADPAGDRLDPGRPGHRLHRPDDADASRRQDRAAQQVPAEDPRRPLDGLHARASPGSARQIHEDRSKAFEYTIKKNTVAVVSDGSAVLGLGNIGPEAAMPVMEGKAMLFKEFADVDAFPICVSTQDADEIVRVVELIAPTFGGINLEDISAPRCFEIEERLKESVDIPVFHDDQHGTAVVMMAALFNALKIVDKPISEPARADGRPRRRRGRGDEDDARLRGHPHRRLRPHGRALDHPRRLRVGRDERDQALVLGELQPRAHRGRPGRRDRGNGPLRRPLGPGDHHAGIAGEDERRRDRLRDGQPEPRGDARGRGPLRADHGHRPLGLPEPDQQRPLLPRDLPRARSTPARRGSPRR